MLLDRVHGVDQGRIVGRGDVEHVEPVAHESTRTRGLEQVLPCRRMEELGKCLDCRHVASLGGPPREFPGSLMSFVDLSVVGMKEDVGVER